jgi:hypothetical protein
MGWKEKIRKEENDEEKRRRNRNIKKTKPEIRREEGQKGQERCNTTKLLFLYVGIM